MREEKERAIARRNKALQDRLQELKDNKPHKLKEESKKPKGLYWDNSVGPGSHMSTPLDCYRPRAKGLAFPRVPRFAPPPRDKALQVGDAVEVYLVSYNQWVAAQ